MSTIRSDPPQELRSPEQLPDVEGERLVFTWDQIDADSLVAWGERIIWRERTGWEVYDRFEEIAVILQRKYGARLRDLVPTPDSRWALFGDSSRASAHVEAARAQLASGSLKVYSFAELRDAVERYDFGAIRLHLLSGGDPDIADPESGITLAEYANQRNRPEMARLLGADFR